jgi:peptidoglycan hydrolase-like protein with peptidoglycan-binding domain
VAARARWSGMTIAALINNGPIRIGATGPAVIAIQAALRNAGHELIPDGEFGTITRACA